jgi:hypothetical protein
MRILIAALAVMTTFPALADEADDAQRLAVAGRDAYWNCLAREYPRDANKNMPEQEFAALIAVACTSERQNFRVALVDYLGMQPGNDAGANMMIWPTMPLPWLKRTFVTVCKAQSRRKVAAAATTSLFLDFVLPCYQSLDQTRGLSGMDSRSVAGILGAIVASIVLVVAIAYGPIGQFGKPASVQQPTQPAKTAPAAPAPRGPVIREVPN